jgi:hypothetical protein
VERGPTLPPNESDGGFLDDRNFLVFYHIMESMQWRTWRGTSQVRFLVPQRDSHRGHYTLASRRVHSFAHSLTHSTPLLLAHSHLFALLSLRKDNYTCLVTSTSKKITELGATIYFVNNHNLPNHPNYSNLFRQATTPALATSTEASDIPAYSLTGASTTPSFPFHRLESRSTTRNPN